VTGGAGFISSNFICHLLEATDHEVVTLDALTYAGNLENLADVMSHPRLSFGHGDIRDAGLVREHVGQVVEVARVGERVERHDLVLGRLEEVAHEVRGDESCSPRDQYALLHSSSSIVYNGRPSTSRWILPSDSPISARTNPWMPRTSTMPAPAKSGPGKSLSAIQ
jgi:nucleoside-diphosphate-sugar epimerase